MKEIELLQIYSDLPPLLLPLFEKLQSYPSFGQSTAMAIALMREIAGALIRNSAKVGVDIGDLQHNFLMLARECARIAGEAYDLDDEIQISFLGDVEE